MTFPTTPIPTTNLDSGTKDPSLARADILQMAQTLNAIMSEVNTTGGVTLLGSDGKLDGTKMPDTIYSTGEMTLSAGSAIININGLARLDRAPKAAILAMTNMIDGDLMLCTDADGGNLALCIYDGTNEEWKYLPLASWTTLA